MRRKPDLVVYLQAPVDVLLDRIARRGIAYEGLIDRGYLTRLNESYARFFHAYDSSPLLIVNAATIDPVHNEADYDELLAQMARVTRGRLYYNPMRHADIDSVSFRPCTRSCSCGMPPDPPSR